MVSIEILVDESSSSPTGYIYLAFIILEWSIWGLFRGTIDFMGAKTTSISIATLFLALSCGLINGFCIPVLFFSLSNMPFFVIPITCSLLFCYTSASCIHELFQCQRGCGIITSLLRITVKLLSVLSQLALLLASIGSVPDIGTNNPIPLVVLLSILIILLSISVWLSSSLVEKEVVAFTFWKFSSQTLVTIITLILLSTWKFWDNDNITSSTFDSFAEFWLHSQFWWAVVNSIAGVLVYYSVYIAICFQLPSIVISAVYFVSPLVAMLLLRLSCELDGDYPCAMYEGMMTRPYFLLLFALVLLFQWLSNVSVFGRAFSAKFPLQMEVFETKTVSGDLIHMTVANIRTDKIRPVANNSRPGKKKRLYICAPNWRESSLEIDGLIKSWADIAYSKEKQTAFLDIDHLEFHVGIDEFYNPRDGFSDFFDGPFREKIRTYFNTDIDIDFTTDRVAYGIRKVLHFPSCDIVIHGKFSDREFKEDKKVEGGKRQSLILYLRYIMQQADAPTSTYNQRDCYVLTVDGDTSFKTQSVESLINSLNQNKKAVAVCGRVKAQSKGELLTSPMVMFQIVEYALAHWLVKEMETVFGSVLCSPGCFSMFRLEALSAHYIAEDRETYYGGKKKRVIDAFAKKGDTPAAFLRYDMGEDRRLCTMLIANGGVLIYDPNAVCWTYCPDNLMELFNQRRRWIASTDANQRDIFLLHKEITKQGHINYGFYFLELLIYISGILSISIIIMMLANAITYIFGHLFDVPLILAIFIMVVVSLSYCAILVALDSPTWNLPKSVSDRYKFVLTAIFATTTTMLNIGLQMILLNEAVHNPTSPAALGLYLLIGLVILAIALHPKEWWMIFPFAVFLIGVPVAYLVLPLYSYCNIVDTRWGTRGGSSQASKASWTKLFLGKFYFVLHVMLYHAQRCCTISSSKGDNVHQIFIGSPISSPHKKDVIEENNEIQAVVEPIKNVDQLEDGVPLVNRNGNDVYVRASKKGQMVAQEQQDVPIEELSEEERILWRRRNHFYDNDISRELVSDDLVVGAVQAQKEDVENVRKGLFQLRNSYLFGILFVNFLWLFLCMSTITVVSKNRQEIAETIIFVFENDFSLNTTLNQLESNLNIVPNQLLFRHNPLSMLFLAIFGIVMFFQVIAMVYFAVWRFFNWLANFHVLPSCFSTKKPTNLYSELEPLHSRP